MSRLLDCRCNNVDLIDNQFIMAAEFVMHSDQCTLMIEEDCMYLKITNIQHLKIKKR